MFTFDVPDMTCGHCASTLARALRAVDPQARLDVDLSARQVRVESDAEATELAAAIQEAGYTARQVAGRPPVPQPTADTPGARAGGGCCGCR